MSQYLYIGIFASFLVALWRINCISTGWIDVGIWPVSAFQSIRRPPMGLSNYRQGLLCETVATPVSLARNPC